MRRAHDAARKVGAQDRVVRTVQPASIHQQPADIVSAPGGRTVGAACLGRSLTMNIKPGVRRVPSSRLWLAALLIATSGAAVSQTQTSAGGLPNNAHASRYGTGWECARGFRKAGEACEAVSVPENGYLS